MKITGKIKGRPNELLFFLGLAPMLFQYLASVTSDALIELSSSVNSMCVLFGLFTWFIVIFQKNNVKQFVTHLLVIGFLYVNDYIVGSSLMLIVYTMAYASRGIKFEKIVKFMFVPFSTLTICLMVVYLFNMARGVTVVTKFRTIDGVKTARYGFYFNQPNSFSLVLFFTVLMFFYVYYNVVPKWIVYMIMVIASIFIYCFPNTKTVSFLLIALILIDVVGNRCWNIIPSFFRRYIVPLFMILNVVIIIVYSKNLNNSILVAIDDLFTWRLRACVQAMNVYGVSIIGQSMRQPLMGYNYMCIDNIYWNCYVIFGLVITAMIFYPLHRMVSHNLNYSKEVLCIIAILMYGFTEAVICPLYAFPVLFIRDYLIGGIEKKDHEEESSSS